MKKFLYNLDGVDTIEEELKSLNPRFKKGAVLFGSARIKQTQEFYQNTQQLAMTLVRHDYFIVTGGGLGIMEAANRGAKDEGGVSAGLCISLPKEQPNLFLDIEVHFEEFWLRKFLFERLGSIFIVCPGGFGTLDELFEILVLMQTHKRPIRPVLLYDKKFWNPLLDFFKTSLIHAGCIDASEMKLFRVVDSIKEVEELLP